MKSTASKKTEMRMRRHNRLRAKVAGTKEVPRLSVFRSNTHISAQLIDDTAGVTLVSASDKGAKGKTKTDRAKEVGAAIAKKAQEKKIEKVVFDRGGFLYKGRVKALADGAREGGLKF